MRARIALVAGMLLVALAGNAIAQAQPTTIAIVTVEIDAKLPQHLAPTAKARIQKGLEKAGYRVQGASASLSLKAVISGKDESTIIEITVVDAATQNLLASVREVCDLCGLIELEERIEIVASLVRSRVEEERGRKPDMTPDPVRVVPPAAPVETTRRSFSYPGAALAGAGALAVGAGVYLLVIDGRGTCKPGDGPVFPDEGAVIRYPDPDDHSIYICRERYETKLPGAITMGLGVAAIAAGVTLMIRGKTERVMVTPTTGGATVGVRLSW